MSPKLRKGITRFEVYLPETLDRSFRQEVVKRKGNKRGSVSEAAREAILLWMNVDNTKTKGRR
jgi:hypothetical protein